MWVLKECTICKEVKELIDFNKDIRFRFGVNYSCKPCQKERIRKYHKANKERSKERSKEYYKANKEHYKEWRKANKERLKEYHREYNKVNKERRKEYNKERRRNSLYRFKIGIRSNIGQTFKRNSITKNSRTKEILGISILDFRKHIERQFTKGMTLDNYGEWHLDHIVPIALATTEEEVIKLNHYSNFQPLWAEENISKKDTVYPVTNLHFKETFGD